MILKRGLISLILILLCAASALAQDASQPLILTRMGDLWEWTGGPTLRQKTEWGYNGSLIISPLNDEVAYSSLATITTDAIKREGGFGGGSLPNNLWVITTQPSDLAYRPADQPPGASLMTPGVPDKAVLRSIAMWSPDATQLAWSETDYPGDGTYRLMVYDKATETVRTLTEGLPAQYGAGTGLYGIWTSKGIILDSYTYNDAIDAPQLSIIVIDPASGQIRLTAPLEDIITGEDTLRVMRKLPVWYEGEEWLAVLYIGESATSQWILIDLDTGALQTIDQTPISTTSQGDPATALHIQPRVINADSIGYDVFQGAGGPQLELNTDEDSQIRQFALSPDGQAIAYQLYDPTSSETDPTIYVWNSGNISVVPHTDLTPIVGEFVWGDITWTVAP